MCLQANYKIDAVVLKDDIRDRGISTFFDRLRIIENVEKSNGPEKMNLRGICLHKCFSRNYSLMSLKNIKIGFAMTGSFCTFEKTIKQKIIAKTLENTAMLISVAKFPTQIDRKQLKK